MPSPVRQKSKVKPAARRRPPPRKSPSKKASKPAPKKAGTALPAKARPAPPAKSSGAPGTPTPAPVPVVRRADGRVHVLSLSFVRDGDEFLARMESDAGQITELKNRSLDQLLTLVASELEDLLE
jgi:hypothetical protein